MAMDAGLVLLPRPTTLVGEASFTTAPLDLSRLGSATFQVWRGPIRVASGSGTFTVFLEESLDCQTWSLGAGVPGGIVIPEDNPKLVSYDMRLRWLRVRFVLAGTDPMVSCWAEGGLGGATGPELLTHSGPADEVTGRACFSKGTVREAMYDKKYSYVREAGSALKPGQRPSGMGFTDGKRFWTWAPPGYDIIDKWGNLIPACPGGSAGGGAAPPVGAAPSSTEGRVMSPPAHPKLLSGSFGGPEWDFGANAGAGALGAAVRNEALQPPDLSQYP